MAKLVKLHTVYDEDIYVNADHIVYATPAGQGTNTRIKLVCGEEILVKETFTTTSDIITERKYIM